MTTFIPHEFLSLYEHERARVLRKRAVWYCLILIVVLGLSFLGGVRTLMPGGRHAPSAQLEAVADLAMFLLHAGALVYLLRRVRSRESLVRVMSAVVILTCSIAILTTPLTDNSSIITGAIPVSGEEAAFAQGVATLIAVFVLHFIATWLVNLSPREGLQVLFPIIAVFTISTLYLSDASLLAKLSLIGLAPLAGLPGFLWSWWLHRSFNERFMAREASRRYADVTRDLAEARRVHEALFPPPLTTGPVRVEYAYEPARQIGGDFLFIHPLPPGPDQLASAARAPAPVPLSIVLIDVTGHGLTAALAVNRLHGELERTFAITPDATPGEVLRTLNQFTEALLSPKAIFATALCLRVEPAPEGRFLLRWASGGHPAALVARRQASGSRSVEQLPSTAPLLGVLPASDFDPGEQTIDLQRGDTLLAYSDGAIEVETADGSLLGVDGLADILGREAGASAREPLPARLLKAIAPLRAAGGGRDDTLIVSVVPN